MTTSSLPPGCFLTLVLIACSAEQDHEPDLETRHSAITGIQGANCATAAPVMVGPDGLAHEFPTVLRSYNLNLQGARTKIDGERVLQLWLPDGTETSEALFAWQGKSGQMLSSPGQLAYAHDYFGGTLGLDESDVDVAEGECVQDVLTPELRDKATDYQMALAQANLCGTNEDGTDKSWQVHDLKLLPRDLVIDAYELIDAGIAVAATHAPADRCILTADPYQVVMPGSNEIIPCPVKFPDDANTEGMVVRTPTLMNEAEKPLEYRTFSAAGTVPMPGDLDQARKILRDPLTRVMFAVGVPVFIRAPEAGPTHVRMIGHRVGPAKHPSPVLRPEERAWVDMTVGVYEQACCHQECTVPEPGPMPAPPPPPPVQGLLADGSSGEVTCQTVCIPEGTCETGILDGLVVMVTGDTWKECFGSCPEPAAVAPAQVPSCKL